MTPYWPSPLGATRRRLTSERQVQAFLFPTDPLCGRAPSLRRFPKANRGIRWVAESELPLPSDLELGLDGTAPGLS
jgi:hypothetical protein